MKKRWIAVIIFAVLLGLAAAWSGFNHIYYGRQFDRRVARLKAQGFPVSLDDLEKAYVLPEGAPNAADIYIEAFTHYQEPNETEQEWLPYVGDYELADDNSELPAEVLDAMSSFLNKNKTTLELLDKASNIETCLWPKTRQDCMLFNDHFSQIKDASKMLQMRNLYYAEMNNSGPVVQSLKSSIALAKTFNVQSFLIDHLMCIAVKSITVKNLNDALSRMPIDLEQLSYFQPEFARMQEITDLYDAFIVDRVYSLEFSRLSYDLQKENTIHPPSYIYQLIYSATGLNKKDFYFSLLKIEEYLAAAQLPLSERSASFGKIDESDRLSFWLYYLMSRVNCQTLNDLDLRVTGNLRCAETALAVERHRLKNNALPETLEQLVPEFMAQVPRDPFDNQPLRYIRRDVGYTLYVIGDDGIDNGGISQEQAKEQSADPDNEQYDWPFTVRR